MKFITITGAALGLTSVLMGAASDHLFSDLLTINTIKRLDVALRYHQLYAILIFILGLYGAKQTSRVYTSACLLFCTGIIIFSGSLYLSLLPKFSGLTYLTPLGGMLLIAAWLLTLLWAIKQSHRDE